MASHSRPYIVDELLTEATIAHTSTVRATQTSPNSGKISNGAVFAHVTNLNPKHNTDHHKFERKQKEITKKNNTNLTNIKNSTTKARNEGENNINTFANKNDSRNDMDELMLEHSIYMNRISSNNNRKVTPSKQLLIQSSENQIDIIGGIDSYNSDSTINNSNNSGNKNNNMHYNQDEKESGIISDNFNASIGAIKKSSQQNTNSNMKKGKNSKTPIAIAATAATIRDSNYSHDHNKPQIDDSIHTEMASNTKMNKHNCDKHSNDDNYNFNYNKDFDGYYDDNGFWIAIDNDKYNANDTDNDDSDPYETNKKTYGLNIGMSSATNQHQQRAIINGNYNSNTYTPELIQFSADSRSNTFTGSAVLSMSHTSHHMNPSALVS